MSEKKDIKDKDKDKEFEVTELDEKELEGAAGGLAENNVAQCGCNVVAGCSC